MNLLSKLKNKIIKPKEPKFLYEVIGLEQGVYELVKNFYEVMETHSEAYECLITHELDQEGKVPDEVKKKLFMFLCGWFGGPNLFVESFGHPRMRARHMHVKIGEKERVGWLFSMWKALDMHSIKISQADRDRFEGSFKALATRIQNQH